jgi:hypothetical protein
MSTPTLIVEDNLKKGDLAIVAKGGKVKKIECKSEGNSELYSLIANNNCMVKSLGELEAQVADLRKAIVQWSEWKTDEEQSARAIESRVSALEDMHGSPQPKSEIQYPRVLKGSDIGGPGSQPSRVVEKTDGEFARQWLGHDKCWNDELMTVETRKYIALARRLDEALTREGK